MLRCELFPETEYGGVFVRFHYVIHGDGRALLCFFRNKQLAYRYYLQLSNDYVLWELEQSFSRLKQVEPALNLYGQQELIQQISSIYKKAFQASDNIPELILLVQMFVEMFDANTLNYFHFEVVQEISKRHHAILQMAKFMSSTLKKHNPCNSSFYSSISSAIPYRKTRYNATVTP